MLSKTQTRMLGKWLTAQLGNVEEARSFYMEILRDYGKECVSKAFINTSYTNLQGFKKVLDKYKRNIVL